MVWELLQDLISCFDGLLVLLGLIQLHNLPKQCRLLGWQGLAGLCHDVQA
jgi:hypothetical protein